MATVEIKGDPEVTFTLTVREAQELRNLLDKMCPQDDSDWDPFDDLFVELTAALDDLGAL